MTFDEFIGMRFHTDADGAWVATLDVQPHHCNPTGNINGAVFLSMADNVSTGAANEAYFARTGERKFMVGIDMHAPAIDDSHPLRRLGAARVIRDFRNEAL